MALIWVLHCVAVAALLGSAAWVGEWVLRGLGRQARWVWGVALLASLLLPLAGWLGWVPSAGWLGWSVWGLADGWLPDAASSGVGAGAAASLESALVSALPGGATSWFDSLRSGPSSWLAWVTSLSLGRVLVVGWLLSTGALVVVLLLSSWRLGRARGSWRVAVVDGVSVLVSRELGPAALGIIRSAIVLPGWVLDLDERARRLILRHEAEHLRAGDPRLLFAGLVGVSLMPWNPVLWCQFSRLRQALELDCDARVLRSEPDAHRYGMLLLDVGRRRSGGLLAVAGLAEPRTFLERRIRMLAKVNFGLNRAQVWGGIGAAALLVLLACEAREPTTPEAGELMAAEAGADLEVGLEQLGAMDQEEALRATRGRDSAGRCTQYFVDGRFVGEEGVGGWSVERLNELEIESIEVVKGAAAGALSVRYPEVRPGCGVVQVFTREIEEVRAARGERELIEVAPARHTLLTYRGDDPSDGMVLEANRIHFTGHR